MQVRPSNEMIVTRDHNKQGWNENFAENGLELNLELGCSFL